MRTELTQVLQNEERIMNLLNELNHKILELYQREAIRDEIISNYQKKDITINLNVVNNNINTK